MKAWLLTWEGTAGPAVEDRNKIVAILSSRRRSSFIEEVVDVIYCRSVKTAEQMAYEANRKKLRHFKYKKRFSSTGGVFYGGNPCIYARVVSNLKIEKDEIKMIEKLSWLEPAYYEQNSANYKIEIIEPEKKKEIIRPLCTLSKDIYE